MKKKAKILICILVLCLGISGNIYASGDAKNNFESSDASLDFINESSYENYNYEDYNFEYKRLKGTVIEARRGLRRK